MSIKNSVSTESGVPIKTNAQTKATERDVEVMKDVLSTQGSQPSSILGQLYSACGVTFTEE